MLKRQMFGRANFDLLRKRVLLRKARLLSGVNDDGSTAIGSLIDDIVREGARWILAAALYIAELVAEWDEHGQLRSASASSRS
ncbi:hypothetical protein ACFYW6_37320 [Streptomyces sp. NPDC002659]|uniref:hypothetical protein n=1 Tax=Streptomyces sp. NPDC002659 TaxID=3364656 RepID=UPI0036A458FE